MGNLEEDSFSISRPWVVLGDFNYIQKFVKKKEGNYVPF